MATHERPLGFRGGLGRWVELDEVAQLADELATVATAGELSSWCSSSPLAPVLASRAGREFVAVLYGTAAGRAALGDRQYQLTAADRREALAVAIVDLADSRRHEAIVDHARERALSVPAAVGTDGSGRSLARCPTCDTAIKLDGHDFYCRQHTADRDAEVAELLEAVDALTRLGGAAPGAVENAAGSAAPRLYTCPTHPTSEGPVKANSRLLAALGVEAADIDDTSHEDELLEALAVEASDPADNDQEDRK